MDQYSQHLVFTFKHQQKNNKPLTKLNSFQRVIFTLSDTTQAFQPSEPTSNDPLEVGYQIALYLDKLAQREESREEADFGLKLLQRIYSFGLAQCFLAGESKQKASTHDRESFFSPGLKPFSSVDDFAKRISDKWPSNKPPRTRIPYWLKYGKIWTRSIESLVSKENPPGVTPVGFICLPTYSDRWLKLKRQDRDKVLEELSQDPTQQGIIALLTSVVNTLWHWEFVSSNRNMYPMRRLDAREVHSGTPAPYLADWKGQSLAVMQKHNHLGTNSVSEDAALLAILMSFFPPQTPLRLLQKGAEIRKRWTPNGDVIERRASDFLVRYEIESLLQDSTRLQQAWGCFRLTTVELKMSEPEMLSDLHRGLAPDLKRFWSFHALMLACGAIPWKSLSPISVGHSFLTQCLRHTVNEFSSDLSQAPYDIRVEVASSLIEASRFPNLEWRKFAIAKAAKVAPEKDRYLRLGTAAANSQLKRLQGHTSDAEGVLRQAEQIVQHETAPTARSRSGLGQIINQRCLNRLQKDDTVGAIESLKSWIPGNRPIEAAVLFHNRLLWARTWRYEGRWDAASARLDELEELQAKSPDLHLDLEEYLPEYVYERAALLIEQDKPAQAETRIREQLERMNSKAVVYPSNVSLRLLLAESLFAQKQLPRQILPACETVQNECRKKFERLHWNIIVAKIHHRRFLSGIGTDVAEQKSIRDQAINHWREASELLGSFEMNEGHSTFVLYESLYELFLSGDDPESQYCKLSTKKMLESTKFGINDKTVKNWIPGFCSAWKKEMESRLVTDWVSKL